tara:strand:+ start:365 stop:838 length:474 start_codon:yes stop_codon:yes gene_type:complete
MQALLVVSGLQANEKLRVVYTNGSPSLTIDRTWKWAQGAMRLARRDGRDATLTLVEQLTQRLIEAVLTEDEDSSDNLHTQSMAALRRSQFVQRARAVLTTTLKGLEALLITYKDDENTCARIRLMRNSIEDNIARIEIWRQPDMANSITSLHSLGTT